MKNGNFTTLDIIKTCKKNATVEIIPSKHIKIKVFYGGKIVAQTEVSHGRNNLARGTYSAIAKQLLLTVDEFDKFLECTLTKELYNEKLKNNAN